MTIFMWEHFDVACVGLIFLSPGLFLVWMPASSFLTVCCTLSTWWGCGLVLWWQESALKSAGPPLCFVAVTALSGAGSASYLLDYKFSDPFLSCSMRWEELELSCWERSQWVFLPWSCSLWTVFCAVACHPQCGLTTYTVVGTALSPASTMAKPAIGPGVNQMLSLQRRSSQRSTEFRYQIAVVMHLDPPWKVWKQPRSQSCLCMPSKPIADMARAIPATGASIVHLDIPWMLSSESQWRQHKSMDHWDAGTGLRFQPSFLSHMTLGEELWFQTCLHMWKTHWYLCTPELRGGS